MVTAFSEIKPQHKPFSPEKAEFFANQLKNYDLTENFVVMNPNASQLAFERRWHFENFVKLINKIASSSNQKIVLIGSKNETNYVNLIHKLCNPSEKIVNLCGKLTLAELPFYYQNHTF